MQNQNHKGCAGNSVRQALPIDFEIGQEPETKRVREVQEKLIQLVRMTPGEIAWRCAEQYRGWQERLAVIGSRNLSRRMDTHAASARLDDFLRRPFYFAAPGPKNSSQVERFGKLFSSCGRQIEEQADLICCGSVRLFGKTVTFPDGEIDWHLDWQTGVRCDPRFYRSMRRADLPPTLDLKRIWEVNRQQFLLTLGKAYWITGETRYAQEIVHLIESWISANPAYCGVNWQESLELALRLLSWVWSLRMIADSGCLSGPVLRRILSSIALQRDYISRHLSVYYSPNTHLLGEALGLFVVDIAFPRVGTTGHRTKKALSILEAELTRQIADDGSHREQSAYYHCYALEMYLLVTILGQQTGVDFPRIWMQKLERMVEFLQAIVQPDGSLARFGDDDGGRTLRLKDEDYYQPRSLLAVAAVLFGRDDFKGSAEEPPEEVFWMFGEEGVQKFLGLPKRKSHVKKLWFRDAKIAVLRSGGSSRAAWIAALCQPMGFLGSGHSHLGFASFELCLEGAPIIVDPGTYSYAAPWRNHFRRMEMHNVAQIDGKHFFASAGPFRWRQTDWTEEIPLQGEASTCAQFGYRIGARTGEPVKHIRSWRLHSSRSASIRDEFVGTGKHQLTFWWHLAPGSRLLDRSASKFLIQSGTTMCQLVLEGFGNCECRSLDGMEEQSMGFYSPRYNAKSSSLTLCVQEVAELPALRAFSILVIPGRSVERTDDTWESAAVRGVGR
jgi:Heparinase II/III N-terminus/Heparinase II/III-like protein